MAHAASSRIQLIDSLIALAVATAAAQLIYCALMGSTFPFNALLSGVGTCVGVAVLTGMRSRRPTYQYWSSYSRHSATPVVYTPQRHCFLDSCAAVALRLQYSDPKAFGGTVRPSALTEYLGCCALLFLVAVTNMG